MSGPYAIAGTQVDDLLCQASGDIYRVVTYIPEGEAPVEGWPVLYLLDADSCFGTCIEALKRMGKRPAATGVCPMVVVGISTPHGYDTVRRQRDYTSAKRENGVQGPSGENASPYARPVLGNAAAREEGQASQFFAFIDNQVKAFVAGKATLDPQRQTLCGHSLAGFFTLWVLANHPAAFTHYAAISPSVWWDGEAVRNFANPQLLAARHIFIAIGEWEDALPPWQENAPDAQSVRDRRKARGMMQSAKDIADELAELAGVDQVRFSVMDEDDHASILCSAMPRVLRLASRVAEL